jgi:hypothetical protein
MVDVVRSSRRSAALVMTVYVDLASPAKWYARIVSYADPSAAARSVEVMTTIDDACLAVRVWLESLAVTTTGDTGDSVTTE